MKYYNVDMMKDMGLRIRIARKQNQMNQNELADRLGLSVKQMSNIENGISACKPDHIVQLVQILGVSSDYLYFGKQSGYIHREITDIDLEIEILLKKANENDKIKIYQLMTIILADELIQPVI